ncbi:hypothetical protein Nepgr_012598 [Nepenthes gracilis]|uniref:Uncharacterized protein n=1 Tax=Nepenthes gracilis TaxID=150966 RepID=A0AAD3SHK2_NEPGR|nr:hypothetical protein Nepgr_012598 [Nepenthes gracilis]
MDYSPCAVFKIICILICPTHSMDLQPVFQSCMQLKVLKLLACKYLNDSCKYLNDSSLEALYKQHVPSTLHELDLSYGTLSQFAMGGLLASCTHLTHFSFNSFKLNCVGCPNFKEVFIPPLALREHMISLNLSLSVNLKQVHLTCSNLCFINWSHCCSLEILKLE